MKTWTIYSTSSTSSELSNHPLVAELLNKMAQEILSPFWPTFKRANRKILFLHQHVKEKNQLDVYANRARYSKDSLAYLPPHGKSMLHDASILLKSEKIFVMGINGDKDTVRSCDHAFNIGVQDHDLRWRAITMIAERESKGLIKFLVTDDANDWDGFDAFQVRRVANNPYDTEKLQVIVDEFKDSESRVIVLNLSLDGMEKISRLAAKSWGKKIIIRRGGATVRQVEGARTIDAVGFHSPDGIVRLLERVHPKNLQSEIKSAVLEASWRIDATYLLATAFQKAMNRLEQSGEEQAGKNISKIHFDDLVREVKLFNGEQCLLETPGRLIAFDDQRMNRSRSITLLEMSNLNGIPSLYQTQFTSNEDLQTVVQMQFQPLWFGEVQEASGTFECDFILSFWADNKNDFCNDLVFPTAVGDLNKHKLADATRALREPADSVSVQGDNCSSQTIRIRGKFRFDPDVSNYPLDIQEFCIAVELSGSSAPFALQPSFVGSIPPILADGWAVIDLKTGRRNWTTPKQTSVEKCTWSIREGVTFRFFFKRTRQDAIARTVLPAAFVILITWLTSFWPDSVQVVTTLVSALLACIGLYFSETKPIPGRSTLVDRLFMVCYGLIGLRLCAVICTFGFSNPENLYHYVNIVFMWFIPLVFFCMLGWTWKVIRR